MSKNGSLPRWDLSEFYPGLDSQELRNDIEKLKAEIQRLTDLFDEQRIGLEPPEGTHREKTAMFEKILTWLDKTSELASLLYAYITSFVTTDSTNAPAQALRSELEPPLARLSMLDTRFAAWMGKLDLEPLTDASQIARDHKFTLEEAREISRHLMSPEQEELASLFKITGSSAWGQLHGNVSSQLEIELEVDGEQRSMPMSTVRNLAYRPDRALRKRAFDAELRTWKAHRVPLAAALNSIKGEVQMLAERRGWESPLQESLFHNRIDQQTLDAMLTAARSAFPIFRRYLKAKARALGLDVLAWYDLFAPLPGDGSLWTYPAARDFIIGQFGGFSNRLQGLARRAFEEHWIDAEPRVGKRDGAFCMHVVDEQSRILANFEPSYRGMATLAHELGHAYHNLVSDGLTTFQRRRPMTLAETASIFCETIVKQAVLDRVGRMEQMRILEASLMSSTQVVVDITSRFQFESGVFDQRAERALSADEFCDLMLQAQKDTYGDALDPDQLHPYMWAVKPHYYSGGRSFYNYPYMFGLLFGLGLYAQYEQDPDAFRSGYDNLLASTGMADAATLAGGFGIDTRSPGFWRESLAVVEREVERFVELAAEST